MKLPDHVYDVLKWFAIVFCDAFACAILALGEIWGIPYAKEISDSMHIIGLFLGTLLGVSSITYYKDSHASVEIPEWETEVDNNEEGEG